MDALLAVLSPAVLLLFVLDPFGNVPLLLAVLRDEEPKRRNRIILREMLIGLGLLLAFLFFGPQFLAIFHLETGAVSISGGVIFFIIGLRLIFPQKGSESLFGSSGPPFIVPIAIPMVAGPSALATLLVMTESQTYTLGQILAALLLAWIATSAILLLAPFFYKVLKQRGLQALERLMGMLLLMISVQMLVDGVRGVLRVGN